VPEARQTGTVPEARQTGTVPEAHPAGTTPEARLAGTIDLDETGQAAMILRAAGWRVAVIDAATPLAVAWQQLAMFPAAVLTGGPAG
jgi:hypothetical protein